MKKLISLLLAAAPVMALAQENYTINGHISPALNGTTAELHYRNGDKFATDSAKIANGSFTFSGQAPEITPASIVVNYPHRDIKKKADVITVYLVTGTTLVNSTDSLSQATVTGTKVNEDVQDFTKFMKPVNDALKALYAEYYATPEDKRKSQEFGAYIDKKQDSILSAETKQDSLYILNHPDSYASISALRSLGGAYPDYSRLQPKFDMLSADLRASKAGVKFQDYLNTLKNVSVGHIAPDFAQADTNGNVVKLSSFRGKYVLLDFWASWCVPCRKETPFLQQAIKQYGDKNFTIISVSIDTDPSKWMQAVRHDDMRWTNLIDPSVNRSNGVLNGYYVPTVPTNLLIGPNATIIARNLRGEALGKKLEQVFKQ